MKNQDAGKLLADSTTETKSNGGKGPSIKDRTGEKRMMSCGQPATIIAYRSSKDIDIQFEDGNIVTNRSYVSFKQGYIMHPDPEQSGIRKYQQSYKNERIGEEEIMNCGMKAKIIDYDGRYKVTLQFEDGTIVQANYSSFQNGEVRHPTLKKPYVKKDKIKGLTNMMSNGMKATIIASRGNDDIDIEFEDGSVVTNRTYSAFKTGNIAHPSKKGDRLGEERMMNNGMMCKIIAYRASKDIDVRFEDGTELYNKDYHAFKAGNIRNPNIVNKKENRADNKGETKKDDHNTPMRVDFDTYPTSDAFTSNSDPGLQELLNMVNDQSKRHQEWLVFGDNNDDTDENAATEESEGNTNNTTESDRELLFEAFVMQKNNATSFYYVEKCGNWYYFKFGPSHLGIPIYHYEDNRLNIISCTEREYNALKKTFLKNDGSSRWIGKSFKKYCYFNFLKENITAKSERVFYRSDIAAALTKHFDLKLNHVRSVDGYKEIDKFSIADQCFVITHDKFYPALTPMYSNPTTDEEKEKIKKDYVDATKETATPIKSNCSVINSEQYDLMQEAIYISKNFKYPQRMITVEGFTAKDLLETHSYNFSTTYEILVWLRKDKEKAMSELANKLRVDAPHLFGFDVLPRFPRMDPNRPRQQVSPLARTDSKMSQAEITKQMLQKMHNEFLSLYTIEMIQEELSQYVLGQEELIKHVATFIYYHIMRQVVPDLCIRPLLTSGPSGSGKTEVWRVAKKLYSKYIDVSIVDGSSITQDGWAGQRKLSYLLKGLHEASILVVDEFDKLTAPSYSRGGDNISHHIQAEFLKILEGDYNSAGFRNDEQNQIDYDTNTLGIVLVGSFEKIRTNKEKDGNGVVGFVQHQNQSYEKIVPITDSDLIEFGVLPEIVGRISDKCTTNKLTAQQYLEIIKSKHSKVNSLMNVIENFGIDTQNVFSDEKILELAKDSESKMLGVRWVSAQIESMLLELLRTSDLRNKFKKEEDAPKENASDSFDEFFL